MMRIVSGTLRTHRFVVVAVLLSSPSSTAQADGPAAARPTAEALVHCAIAAGLAGQADRKAELLAEALRQSPDLAAAHWQRGEVRVGDRWQSLAAIQQASAADARLAEYRRRRAAVKDDLPEQLALAKWCQVQGLVEEARAHFSKILELAPGHEQAVVALKLKNFRGQWLTQEQIDRRLQAEQQDDGNLQKWKPMLQSLAKRIEQGSETDRSSAIHELHDVTDPSAIGALSAVCLKSGVKAGREFVSALAVHPQQAATEALLRQSVLHPAPVVRSAGMHALKTRSLHDYVPILISALQAPLRADLDVDTDLGTVRFAQTVRQQGAVADRSRRSEVVMPLNVPNPAIGFFLLDGLSIVAQAEAKAERQAKHLNRISTQLNDRIYAVLAKTTGEELDRSPRDWWDWWYQYIDYYQGAKRPTSEENYFYHYEIPYYVSSEPRYSTGVIPAPPAYPRPAGHSCFARGTKVWTLDGPVAIETVQMGDRVLSQDPETGELAYKPVLRSTVRKMHPTVRVQLGSDAVVATRGHLFWVDPLGWKMTRELQSGMRLHGVDRDATVDGVQEHKIQDVYNLVVADFGTYFVGESQVLVHDNTMRQPTLARVPGMAFSAN
jgi:hypothetical protein